MPLIVNVVPAKVPVTPAGNAPVNVAPVAPPPIVYTIGVMAVPEHTVGVALPEVNTIVDKGFTVIVYVFGVPVHGAIVGVTVIVAVIGAPVKFVAVNEAISPTPDAARPIAGLLFVHAYVAPAGVLANAVAATVPPLHTITFAGTVTVDGTQATAVHVAVPDAKQPAPVGVTVSTTTSPGASGLTVKGDVPTPTTGAPAFTV